MSGQVRTRRHLLDLVTNPAYVGEVLKAVEQMKAAESQKLLETGRPGAEGDFRYQAGKVDGLDLVLLRLRNLMADAKKEAREQGE